MKTIRLLWFSIHVYWDVIVFSKSSPFRWTGGWVLSPVHGCGISTTTELCTFPRSLVILLPTWFLHGQPLATIVLLPALIALFLKNKFSFFIRCSYFSSHIASFRVFMWIIWLFIVLFLSTLGKRRTIYAGNWSSLKIWVTPWKCTPFVLGWDKGETHFLTHRNQFPTSRFQVA